MDNEVQRQTYKCIECGEQSPIDERLCLNCGVPNPQAHDVTIVDVPSNDDNGTLRLREVTIASVETDSTVGRDVDAAQRIDTLEGHLEEIKRRDRKERAGTPRRAYVVLFGSSGAGKTFLIDRIQAVDPDSVTKATTNLIRAATKTNEFNPISFEFKGTLPRRPVTLIDIPGEEFRAATDGRRSQLEDQVRLSIKELNGVILYISARDLVNGFRGGSTVAPDAATEKNYIDLLKVVHLTHCANMDVQDAINDLRQGFRSPARGKSNTPIFVAVSQSDTLSNWNPDASVSCEDLLRRHAGALLQVLQERFLYFACGLVASHVNAPAYTGLRFTRMDPQQKPVPVKYDDTCAQLLEGYRFRNFIEEHWNNSSSMLGADKQTLPTRWGNRTRAQHLADAIEFFADKDNAADLQRRLNTAEIRIEQRPFAENSCLSYGVGGMLDKLQELYIASEADRDRNVVNNYLKEPKGAWRPVQLIDTLARTPAARLLNWFSLRSRLPGKSWRPYIFVFFTLVCMCTFYALWELAAGIADAENKTLRNRIAAQKYPRGFSIKPVDAWAFSDSEPIEKVIHGVASTRHAIFGLQDHYLVRPPDLSVNGLVDEKNVPFEALRTSVLNSRAERLFQTLRCSEPHFCEPAQELMQLPRLHEVLAATSDGRVFSYAVALAYYQRLTARASEVNAEDALTTITRLLQNFEERRVNTYSNSEGNKQKLLPQLAAELMQAHARFASDRSASLASYGEAIVHALQPKRGVIAEELRLIGVSQELLAQHLLATSFVVGVTMKGLSDTFDKRLRMIGLAGGTAALFDSGNPAAANPTLMCIVGQVAARESLKAPPFERIANICSNVAISKEIRETNPDFWRRADLTDVKFWSGSDIRRQQYPLEQHLSLIQQTLMKPEFIAAMSGEAASGLQDLLTLRKESSWTVMSRPIWLIALFLLLGVLALMCGLFDRVNSWVLGRDRFNTRLTVDPIQPE